MSASKQQTPKHGGSGHQHPVELRERAVRMVQETMKETGEHHGGLLDPVTQSLRAQTQLDCNPRHHEINGAQRPGITTKDQQRIAQLEKEVRELRRANEILKGFINGARNRDKPSRSPARARRP